MGTPIFSGQVPRAIQTLPRTEGELRETLARLSRNTSVDAAALEALGDRLDIVENLAGTFDAEFDSNAVIGQPVYVSSNANVDLAQANAIATSDVVGFATEAVTAGNVGPVARSGRVTKSDWTAIIGSATLTAGARYFLSPTTAGQLTATAPSTAGQVSVLVGRALSTTTLLIEPEPGVFL